MIINIDEWNGIDIDIFHNISYENLEDDLEDLFFKHL